MAININISIEKRHLVIFSCLIVLFGIVLVTNAFGGVYGDPEVMGHSANELEVDVGSNPENLQNLFNSILDNSGNIDYANTAGSANNVDWSNVDNKPSVIENSDSIATETWVNNQDYATQDYVDSSIDSYEACNWEGWKPDTITGETCYVCGCAVSGSQAQLYCDNGKITDVRTNNYCSKCDYNCISTCLVAGTSVLMADNNFENIEDIQKGDYVINEKGEKDKVIGLWQPIIGDRNTYIINNNIEVTPDHPFMTTEGWKVIDLEMLKRTQENTDLYQSIEATELKVGDVLITKDGKQVIETIEENSERTSDETVYTLILENGEGFYAEDYLVADGE